MLRHRPLSSPEDPLAQDQAWQDYLRGLRGSPPSSFQRQLEAFHALYAHRRPGDGPPRVWRPSPETVAGSNLGRFMAARGIAGYERLHAWSVAEREAFWAAVIQELGIVFRRPPQRVLDASGGGENPRWLPGARMSIVDSCFRAEAGRAAVVSGREGSAERTITTYGELEELTDRFANGLAAAGFAPGDPIALYVPMTVECVAAYLGAVRAGCPVVSIADSFPPPEIARRLAIGGARGVVTGDVMVRAGRRHELYAKVRQAGAQRVIVIATGDEAPALAPGDRRWSDFLASPEPPAGGWHAGDPYAVTNVLFSSGTTAEPKAIPWTHLTPIKCAMDGYFHQDVRPSDVVAWPTNVGWMMGPWLIYATLINGATMALYDGAPHSPGFVRFVAQAGVTVLGVVPSLVRAWRSLEEGSGAAIDWRGVRVLSSTGEPSGREDYLWLMSRTGYRAPVIEYCGGTEIGGGYVTGTVVQPASPACFTTPALGLDFLLLGEAPGQGEVFLVPPSIGLSQSLLNRDHHQVYYAGCPAGPEGRVLRRHGDRMEALPGGFFRAQGRSDDTMNLGGIKVGALEIERVVESHPRVREAAAVAVQPGGEGAEALVLFAVAEEGTRREELQRELDRRLAAELNPLFRIRELVLTGELPRTASNKLMRRSLRAAYREG